MSDETLVSITIVVGLILFLGYISSLSKDTTTLPKEKKTKKRENVSKKEPLEKEVKELLSTLEKSKKIVQELKKQDTKKSEIALKRISDKAYSVCEECY
ncbi:MAG: hypothetical protein GXO60_07185 [Epsilonproteobacteria bacterium]|nr:hypothetical protein [Campylobacterota bacterium]